MRLTLFDICDRSARWMFGHASARAVLFAAGIALTTTVPAIAGVADQAFGSDTRGGLDGKMVLVNTLAAHGPGSLAEALAQPFPRLIVFEVGGVIDLNQQSLIVNHPHLSIAGQTAPEPGITLIRGGLIIRSHDVIVQHIRVRPGDAGQPALSGWEPDAITITGANAYNVLIDHVSTTWAIDENISVSGPRDQGTAATSHDVTIRNSLIAEALDYSSHKKGKHSKGALVHDFSQRVAFIGNLFAHNARRNPYFKAHTSGAIINNLIYNADSAAIEAGYVMEEWQHGRFTPEAPRLSIAGNVLRYGRDSFSDLALVADQAYVWLQDNQVRNLRDQPMPLTHGSIQLLKEPPVWPAGVFAAPADTLTDTVLKSAGARPRQRDAIDQRIVQSVRTRNGRIIDSQTEVGGYPQLPATRRPLSMPSTAAAQWLASFTKAVEYANEN